MQLTILTPEESLYDNEVKSVEVPGTKGRFVILNDHAPIISTLEKGVIRLTKEDESEEKFDINGGVIECHNNVIKILVEK